MFRSRLSSSVAATRLLGVPLVCLFLVPFAGCERAPLPKGVYPPSVTRTGDVEVTDEPPAVDLAKDWPWWRGPSGNNLAACESAPTTWDETTNVVWSVPVPGRGHASPCVAEDAVFLATADEQSQRQMVVAFDRATGELRWERVVHEGGFSSAVHEKSSHANGTVACDGERIFASFLHNDAVWLYALDLAGEVVWSKEIGAFQSQHGYAPSPAIYGSAVLVALDSESNAELVAVDRATGEIAWRALRQPWASYSSPTIGKIAGRDQILLTGALMLASYDPKTGEELWRVYGGSGTTCGTPAFDEHRVFASGGYPENETWAVKVDGSASILWSKSDRVYEPSLLATKGLLFGVNDDGIAVCWDAASGEELWKTRIEGRFSASPVACGGNIYATSDRSETFVFEATGEDYVEVAVNKLGTDAYATPAICDGRIYLRVGDDSSGTRQERLVCIGE